MTPGAAARTPTPAPVPPALVGLPGAVPPAMVAGPYELLRHIATGGMGEVFIGRRRGAGAFEKRVAVKLLLPHLEQSQVTVQRFLDEARMSARMNHPNIVQVFEVGHAGTRPFIAMSLVEGVSLATLLRACRDAGEQLPVPVLRLLAQGICQALTHAHTLQGPNGEDFRTVHRDLTPSNILVSLQGGVFVTDFGIAKAQDSSMLTGTGQMLGKYAYMAPEQLRPRAEADPRADVYSAALTLYEASTLVCPFKRENEPATLDAVRQDLLQDPRVLRPDLPSRWASALMRGAERALSRRYASSDALLEGFGEGRAAKPAELGAIVSRLCAPELERFSENTHPGGLTLTGTHGAPVRARAVRVSTRRAGGAVAAVAAAAVLALLWRELDRPLESRTELSTVVATEPRRLEVPPSPPQESSPGSDTAGDEAFPTIDLTATAPPLSGGPHGEASPTPGGALRASSVRAPSARGSGSLAAKPRGQTARTGSVRIGYLSVDATPWATVWVNGIPLEQTPLSRYPIPAGRQSIVFKNPAFGEVRRTALIVEGKELNLHVDLRRER